jgi:hypothetical protein
MLTLTRIALPLLAASALAQGPSNSGFRLSFVEKIYIDPLGEGDTARIVHDQLTGAFMNRTRGLILVTDRSQADAILTGTASIKTGYSAMGRRLESIKRGDGGGLQRHKFGRRRGRNLFVARLFWRRNHPNN